MREFLGSLLILLLCVALTIVGIAVGYPDHPYAVGSVMILAACSSLYLFERTYVRPDLIDAAKRDANRLLYILQVREFLRDAKNAIVPGVFVAFAAFFVAMMAGCSATVCYAVGAAFGIVTLILSVRCIRMLRGPAISA